MSEILRVLTYNIHKGSSHSQRYKLAEMRKGITQTRADLVFLQEIYGQVDDHDEHYGETDIESQLEFLADTIWPHQSYGQNAVRKEGHYGNALMSRHPIQFSENIDITLHRFERRGFLHSVIEVNRKKLHLICLHLNLLQFHREKQIRLVAERIHSHIPDDEALMICGDFNDWLAKAHPFFSESLNLKEAHMEVCGRLALTFPAFMPLLPLDRIYFRGIDLRSVEVLKSSPWDALSDHCPLLAEFHF
jgi:endonuclease/exonuclease/phosphatase family metal-dependent hydrolase